MMEETAVSASGTLGSKAASGGSGGSGSCERAGRWDRWRRGGVQFHVQQGEGEERRDVSKQTFARLWKGLSAPSKQSSAEQSRAKQSKETRSPK